MEPWELVAKVASTLLDGMQMLDSREEHIPTSGVVMSFPWTIDVVWIQY